MAFVIAFVLSVAATPLVARLAVASGIVDRPGALKVHARPVPLAGAAVIAAWGAACALAGVTPSRAILAAALMGLTVGVADDIRDVPPAARLVLAAGAGTLLVSGDLTLGGLGPLAAVATVVACVAAINGVNLSDGLDGLVPGLVAISAAGLAGVAAASGRPAVAAADLALAGAAAGFLVWNRPPARVFLGDGGAYAIGAALAGLGLAGARGGGWAALIGTGTCLAPFALELADTVLRRLRGRHAMSAGDRGHVYDRLVARGATVGRAVVTMWSSAAFFALLGVVMVLLRLDPRLMAVEAGIAFVLALSLYSRIDVPEEVPQ